MDPNALFKNITRVKSFKDADLETANNQANEFIENTLEADPDHNYAVRISNGYWDGGNHVVVLEYTYIMLPEAL